MTSSPASRREFLRHTSGALAGAALASAISARTYAAEENTIPIALVGCGGRGGGAAADALRTAGPTKLFAAADVFPERLTGTLKGLAPQFPKQVDVPAERQFLGMDAYRKAIDALPENGVVLLATPPAFRPAHFEYAVAKGRHVFMEKSFAVDAPGVRRVLAAGKVAQEKGLKVAGGLMWRHDPPREEVMRRIHEGAIGDLILLRTYRMHGAVGLVPKAPGTSELAHQIRNYNNFTWVNGGFFLDWLIHNLDICCWAKNALPVSAQGQAGRAARTAADQVLDHYMVEYVFPDGARFLAQGRHIDNCYSIFSDFAHGTRGSAIMMTNLGAADPKIYKGQNQTKADEAWRYEGPTPNPYQVEHDLLFDAIRNNKPYNEAERCAHAALIGIMGRMAAHSGQLVTWEQALNSKHELAPGLDKLTWDGPAPVMPDAEGRYPLATPGKTVEL